VLWTVALVIVGTGCSSLPSGSSARTSEDKSGHTPPGLELASVGSGTQSRLAISHWPYDKYPDLPEVTPKSKTVLLNADGPGVVTMFHVSKYGGGDQGELMLRVWYDGEAKPAIEMPWMDFLGDPEAKTAYFGTVYFSLYNRPASTTLRRSSCPTEVRFIITPGARSENAEDYRGTMGG
jgi:hypothetical protein